MFEWRACVEESKMTKAMLGLAVVLAAVVANPAQARPHHGNRHFDYSDRYYESRLGHYRAQVYDHDRYTGRAYRDGYDHYEPRRDSHYLENLYSYDRHAPRSVRRQHRRNHH
ncbi:MAG: hypothetical protein EBR34_08620 [Sphingomonadaceae bacterium]|nr:hypothetical protein [Sphingomonadaceae bacterium]